MHPWELLQLSKNRSSELICNKWQEAKNNQEIGSKNKTSSMNMKPAHDTTIECNVATSIQLYDREASSHEFLGK
jgi:hypothetical protein